MSDHFSIIAFKKGDLPSDWQSYNYTHFFNAVRMSVERFVDKYAGLPGFWALLNAVNEAGYYHIDLPEDHPKIPNIIPPERKEVEPEVEDEDEINTQQIRVNRKTINLITRKLKDDLTTSNKVVDFLFHLALRERQGDDISSFFEQGATD